MGEKSFKPRAVQRWQRFDDAEKFGDVLVGQTIEMNVGIAGKQQEKVIG